jgi:hypothetical protein
MKVIVSLQEYFDKNDGATVSVVIFTLRPDHKFRYNLNSPVNEDVKKELQKYQYFSMYPDSVEDYNEVKRNPKKQKFANKINSYIPQHVRKIIDKLDGKSSFVYYQQFHLNTL